MHNNYYFLRQLSSTLTPLLTGTVISECFSQNKDELVIRFETHTEPFFIKASLEPSFSCLSFPRDFNRARKNSVDLFEKLIGQRVTGIRQFTNERSFAILLTDDLMLLFKMHGNRCNIILLERNIPIELFRNNIVADANLDAETLDRTIDWSYEAFLQHRSKLQSLYFTFGKIIWKYLEAKKFDRLSPEEQWLEIQAIKQQLEQPVYFIAQSDASLYLSLIRYGNIVSEFREPVKAINDFFYTYTHQAAFIREKASALSTLRNKLQGSEQYYQKTFDKLSEVESENPYKVWADLIMANMHQIKPGMDKITLPDFYHENKLIDVKLKKDISPQKNAEAYYRKAKNQHIEIQRLQQSLETKEKEMEQLKQQLHAIESIDELKSLRKAISHQGLTDDKEKQPVSLPFHEFEHNGFRIWVGRNAQSNDILTFKYGFKEDLWLHAKDVAGSHVLIKYQSGKNFPKDVIERAAQLAAYNSKRKTETLCPVIVTPKKFVRKRKGDPAGAVVVDREDVILVEPVGL
ncbi:MAG TPA: NFACT RNA binding domain-containing protein [Ohtaekwangia sp.]|uniref:NFACT RNA binding domain-containing protein n=1 Tax=Ohtaekwangia sp. TaxID=2066019 RepID=UPI002F93ECA5